MSSPKGEIKRGRDEEAPRGTIQHSGGSGSRSRHADEGASGSHEEGSSRHNGCCQVPSCNADLSSLKTYYLRYRICEKHSQMQVVDRGDGVLVRFCQLCGRFHNLEAFDDTKRSCRVRLAKNNARRRKGGAAQHSRKSAGRSRRKAASKNSETTTEQEDTSETSRSASPPATRHRATPTSLPQQQQQPAVQDAPASTLMVDSGAWVQELQGLTTLPVGGASQQLHPPFVGFALLSPPEQLPAMSFPHLCNLPPLSRRASHAEGQPRDDKQADARLPFSSAPAFPMLMRHGTLLDEAESKLVPLSLLQGRLRPAPDPDHKVCTTSAPESMLDGPRLPRAPGSAPMVRSAGGGDSMLPACSALSGPLATLHLAPLLWAQQGQQQATLTSIQPLSGAAPTQLWHLQLDEAQLSGDDVRMPIKGLGSDQSLQSLWDNIHATRSTGGPDNAPNAA